MISGYSEDNAALYPQAHDRPSRRLAYLKARAHFFDKLVYLTDIRSDLFMSRTETVYVVIRLMPVSIDIFYSISAAQACHGIAYFFHALAMGRKRRNVVCLRTPRLVNFSERIYTGDNAVRHDTQRQVRRPFRIAYLKKY